MPVIIVEVMPKAEILDPQGKAVTAAIRRLDGSTAVSAVRIGKRFELTVDASVDDAMLARVRELADELLANTVIEDVISVREAP